MSPQALWLRPGPAPRWSLRTMFHMRMANGVTKHMPKARKKGTLYVSNMMKLEDALLRRGAAIPVDKEAGPPEVEPEKR